MSSENQFLEKKSLRIIQGSSADFEAVARECVGFANARGGLLLIGIEDEDDQPPAEQKIDDQLVDKITKRIPQMTNGVVLAPPRKCLAENGGEFIEVRIFQASGIAATSDGKYYLRVVDDCRPLLPDELLRLVNDRPALIWETQSSQQVPNDRFNPVQRRDFLERIRNSERVSPFVKAKSDGEILEHYLLEKDGFLTNLGVLWIGRREDRATLPYAPAIQFLKFDERERKVNKLTWDDHSLNPLELIEAVLRDVPDWREFYELPDGLFRRTVPHYDERVLRELLANALVHRPYTQRGDIFLNLYPDRLEVHNPGLLPIGVTPQNILHQSVARNTQLATVFRELKLMEKEGSGYDLMYDLLLSNGKPAPLVVERNDRVVVTIYRQFIDPTIVDFLTRADEQFQLTQRERVTLGLIAQNESLIASELARELALGQVVDIHLWLGRLPRIGIVQSRGRTRGKEYLIAPETLKSLDFKGLTSLKKIESHRLRALILEDLRIYRQAGIGEIQARIGSEIPRRRVQHALKQLVDEGQIIQKGTRKYTKYHLPNLDPLL